MALGVKLLPVSQLLDKEFFIRSYQRGYRWTADQVNDLLNDFKDFIDRSDKHDDEFYCLQPIVVKTLSEEELSRFTHYDFQSQQVFEVIDGQQRITTITILLNYLSEALKGRIELSDFPKITYQVRPRSKAILADFKTYFFSDGQVQELADNIDFFHMKGVYDAICEWFQNHQNQELSFLKLLTAFKVHCVKVIWYEVSSTENSIEVFRRFNAGKISLTNAELIKALFLQENINVSVAVKYSISKEWQHIENQLQNSFFWGFLNPVKSGSDRYYSSRIEYVFDLLFAAHRKALPVKSIEDFDNQFGKDEHKVFRYFANLIEKSDDLLSIWDKVNAVYEKFNQWFRNPEHYHYIGYLQNMEGIGKGENIVLDILTYHDKHTGKEFATKQALTEYLKAAIQGKVKAFFANAKVNIKYGATPSSLRNLFFLFNVETCVKLAASAKGEEIYNLPFSLNSEINYDIEHIDSKTDKAVESLKPMERVAYLRDIELDFGHELDASFKERLASIFVDPLAQMKWADENIDFTKVNDVLNDVLTMLETLLERDSDQVKDRDAIGNLTLLNDSINRSYGNAYFNTKRRLIIEKDLEGVYIPISTKNVFMKYYSGQFKKHTRWGEEDAKNYQLKIEETLADFAK